MSYIKFKVPDKLKEQIKNTIISIAEAKDNKIRKGMNETTKSIERGQAKLVVMAEDVSPPEILFHIPFLCEEKKVPYTYISTRKILGNAVKINVGSASIAVVEVGTGNENILEGLLKQLNAIKS